VIYSYDEYDKDNKVCGLHLLGDCV
jgi:hypothetical protein